MENKGIIHAIRENATYSSFPTEEFSLDMLKEVFNDLFFNRVSPNKPIRMRVTSEGYRIWRFYHKEISFIKRLKRQYGRKR